MHLLRPSVAPATAPSFVDARSGVRFEFHTPFERPDLWQRYLEGAETTYRVYGVEGALELGDVRDGLSTTLFAVGLAGTGEVVAGVRFQGPFIDPADAHISAEFAGSAGEEMVRSALEQRLVEGVVEFKGGWAQPGHPEAHHLSDAIARCFTHAMRWLDVRHGCCSAAAYATGRWESSGGRAMAGLPTIPYPTPEYQTTLLWWDQRSLVENASAEQWQRIEEERHQIDQCTSGVRSEELGLLSAA